jgi:hypothetical protein
LVSHDGSSLREENAATLTGSVAAITDGNGERCEGFLPWHGLRFGFDVIDEVPA